MRATLVDDMGYKQFVSKLNDESFVRADFRNFQMAIQNTGIIETQLIQDIFSAAAEGCEGFIVPGVVTPATYNLIHSLGGFTVFVGNAEGVTKEPIESTQHSRVCFEDGYIMKRYLTGKLTDVPEVLKGIDSLSVKEALKLQYKVLSGFHNNGIQVMTKM